MFYNSYENLMQVPNIVKLRNRIINCMYHCHCLVLISLLPADIEIPFEEQVLVAGTKQKKRLEDWPDFALCLLLALTLPSVYFTNLCTSSNLPFMERMIEYQWL